VRHLGILIGLLATVAGASAATVATDYPDYAPGEVVAITGAGWEPGETVVLVLHEDPAECPERELTAIADDEGDIANSDFVVDEHDVGVTFSVTATGLTSGLTAETTFTDACGQGQVADPTCSTSSIADCTIGCRKIATGECDPVATAPAPRGTVCRAKTGPCDAAETCIGSEKSCPADVLAPPSQVCRPPAGPCDVAETCTGNSVECPQDGFVTEIRICRPADGPCDVPEKCSGTSPQCPEDTFTAAGTVCRAAAGSCDVAETCSGTSGKCPTDEFSPPDTVCRTATGPCDVAEKCSGLGAQCPADGFVPSGTLCRRAAGVCDVDEKCDGLQGACPADAKSTAVCRGSAGACDVAETCDGVSNDCPPDAKSTGVCRGAAGECDVAEKCDGVRNECPADAKSTGVCRASAGVCDLTEKCDGVSNDCPPDAKSTALCRSAAGVCDVAESCDGIGNECPADRFKSSTTVCRAASGVCDQEEKCTGSGPACPSDVIQPKGASCPADSNPCTKDICNGVDTECHHPIGSCSVVTNSELCTFDVDSMMPGDQFRLIFTPDKSCSSAGGSKLNASNPGQFFYNVIYTGPGNRTIDITLPYPFVTQGATPIHVYSNVTTSMSGDFMCFTPGTEISHKKTQVDLSDYSPKRFGSTETVSVNLPSLPNGIAYINIHLDYGLKGTTNYAKDANNNAIGVVSHVIRIPDKQTYTFSDTSPGSDTTQSENSFTR
jgi:hypothetical protein